GGQRRNLYSQPDQRMAVCGEVVRIRHPIALDIRTIRVLWIGPPIVAFREVVVLAARATRTRRSRDRDWRLLKILFGCGEHARALKGCEIEARGRGLAGSRCEFCNRHARDASYRFATETTSRDRIQNGNPFAIMRFNFQPPMR